MNWTLFSSRALFLACLSYTVFCIILDRTQSLISSCTFLNTIPPPREQLSRSSFVIFFFSEFLYSFPEKELKYHEKFYNCFMMFVMTDENIMPS